MWRETRITEGTELLIMETANIRLGEDGLLYFSPDRGAKPFDFNGKYRGFYPACVFSAAEKCSDGFYIAGQDRGGEAHLFTSITGGEWTETEMVPKDHPASRRECGRVLAILESNADSHIYLVCENGYIFTLPGCPKCVKETRYPRKFTGAALEGENLVVSCENGETVSVLLAALWQLRTSWSYALPALEAGGLLFDMREEEDCEQTLPYGQFVSVQTALRRIRTMDPAASLFLFCYTGVQADTLAQYARALGHMNTFSLGGPKHLLEKNEGRWPRRPADL